MLDPLGLYEYRVALHVHSQYSDGSEPPDTIIVDAQRAGVDVLWLTDHDTRRAAESPGPGYYGHVLFLVGTEITPPTNHYLALGDIPLIGSDQPLQTVIDQVRSAGGLGFIAHPDDPGNPTARLPSYGWSDRDVDGFTGLEIWNHVSDWGRQIQSIPQGICAALRPFKGWPEAHSATLAAWDRLGQDRRVVGIGGVDAHAQRVGVWPFRLTIFPYRASFRAIRTHVYTDEPLDGNWRAAEAMLLEALRLGRASVIKPSLGEELGFRQWAEHPRLSPVPMGAEVDYAEGWRLRGLSPVPVDWDVVHNGSIVHREQGTLLDVPIAAPGVWRTVVRRGPGREVWIYANPIYMR